MALFHVMATAEFLNQTSSNQTRQKNIDFGDVQAADVEMMVNMCGSSDGLACKH